MSNPAVLVAEADRASAAQNFTRAQALLREAAEVQPGDFAILMRLAGVSRALSQPRVALDAVHRALAVAPLDFAALLMRASLLERIGDPSAGEAWSRALAQRPDGPLPPQLEPVVAEGEQRCTAWLDAREARLKAAMTGPEQAADIAERKRIARFRTNALRRTRPFHSEPTHFHFPELTEREFHPSELFPWLVELEAATDLIAAEFGTVMGAERAELVPYIQYPDHAPLRQWQALNRNPDWTAIHLMQNGRRIDANARHCPQTMSLLDRIPQPRIAGCSPNAMFSLLAPGTRIPPHTGVANTRLVCHLPLIVPEGCWFRVGAETRAWQRGAAFLFDDTIEHEAMNPSDLLRVVFIIDAWHPDLSPTEQAAIKAMMEAEGAGVAGL
ncbi:aspartyl/asparaginyl beta-hydroxylase domain-containing protein [Sphingomonas sp. So64.6b]|uniref:aspartyl/asparaginyl beta-hydroxylase domain-containing protein n=1 Tax=Sphingomonas sp. So64.6b TaxID=2997354 RepID=UPI001FCEB727|nr:aspartyl/asparaginyl beta-hydroxylase domain-containing protein [Sphingomonas sp. So64.6b]